MYISCHLLRQEFLFDRTDSWSVETFVWHKRDKMKKNVIYVELQRRFIRLQEVGSSAGRIEMDF